MNSTETIILQPSKENIEIAAAVIKNGGNVAFPTETVYGLGANALDSGAVARIYEIKGRPSDNPTIVHIAEIRDMQELADTVTEQMHSLAEAFWPGPLTMVVRKLRAVPDATTAGLSTVGIRMPNNEIALSLIKAAGCPIAAPSANLSGRPSPTRASHVFNDLSGKIGIILDGGDCAVGIESTVLYMTEEHPVILRPGAVGRRDIARVLGYMQEYHKSLGKVTGAFTSTANSEFVRKSPPESAVNHESEPHTAPELNLALEEEKKSQKSNVNPSSGIPKSPGMKYRHYAPKAPITVFAGAEDAVNLRLQLERQKASERGEQTGVLIFELADIENAARVFFASIRDMDTQDKDAIYLGLILNSQLDDGAEFAYLERLLRSSDSNIILV